MYLDKSALKTAFLGILFSIGLTKRGNNSVYLKNNSVDSHLLKF